MKKNNRNIIIGLDGVPFGLLKSLSEKGVMQNTQYLIREGTFRKMSSSMPEVSSVAWSSIITGANPAEHGIYGFTDIPLDTYRLSFPNFSHLAVPAFWERGVEDRHVIINVPSTYPARPLNGILISGFVALDLERAVYPESILPVLKEMEYSVDVDSGKAHQSMELFMKELNRTNEKRVSLYRRLWMQDWDTFMFVFTGSDRLLHFLWDACGDPNHNFHRGFNDYFRRVDKVIGEILSGKRDEDNFIMLSDHGFERLEKDVYINSILKKEGFLKLEPDKTVKFGNIACGTKAFALDPARIYVNLTGKYPKGTVDTKAKEAVIRDIEGLFRNLKIENKKVIRDIYRKEKIYRGPHIDRAPDLVLVADKGFNLKASLSSDSIFSKGVFTGKHTQDDAFLLVSGKCDELIPRYPNVCDVLGIMDKLRGRVHEKRNA